MPIKNCKFKIYISYIYGNIQKIKQQNNKIEDEVY